MPASRTAKSAACDDGKRSATKSSNVPVKPGSPCQVGHVAMARVTDVWNRRTLERSPFSRSTLMSIAPVLPLSGSVGKRGAVDGDLDVGPLAFLQVGDLVVAVLGEREQHPVVVVAAGRRLLS